jgi:hypothetical protein
MATLRDIESQVTAAIPCRTHVDAYGQGSTALVMITTERTLTVSEADYAEYVADSVRPAGVVLTFSYYPPRPYGGQTAPSAASKEITKLDVFTVAKAYGGDYREQHLAASRWHLDYETHDGHIFGMYAHSERELQACRRQAIEDFERYGRAPARSGINNSPRMQCKRSQYHGFHPVNEACPLCE